jgi:hypothetical protein
VVYVYNPSYLGGRGRKTTVQRQLQAKNARPCLKNKVKRLGEMAQMVEQLAGKLESWVQSLTLHKYVHSTFGQQL